MSSLIVLIIVLVFAMCFSLFNYWFQKDKYNRLSKEERNGMNPLSSPTAWLIYFAISLLMILGIISFYVYKLMLAIMEMNR